MMNETEKEMLYSKGEDYLEGYRDKSGKGYLCPRCGSGSGGNGTGATINPSAKGHPRLHCWACDWYGDVIDYIAEQYSLTPGQAEAWDKARAVLGVDSSTVFDPKDLEEKRRAREAESEKHRAEAEERIRRAAEYIYKHTPPAEYDPSILAYLQSRGISEAAARKLGLSQTDDEPRRLIVPYAAYTNSFRAYYTRKASEDDPGLKVRNLKGVPMGVTGAAALRQGAKPVFITEGFADAASYITIGHEAVSLNGVGNCKRFIEYIRDKEIKAQMKCRRFIVALDADEAGRREAASLLDALKKEGYPAIIFDIVKDVKGMDEKTIIKKDETGKVVSKPVKDANDALQVAPELLKNGAAAAEDKAKALSLDKATQNAEDRKKVDAYKVGNLLDSFFDKLQAEDDPIPTGFKRLDKIISGGTEDDEEEGGLLPKLYVLGALSSLGKTTFALQIADNIAKQGRDVYIFALEMPKETYIAKSISRTMYEITQEKDSFKRLYSEKAKPKSEQEITIPRRRKRFSEEDRNLFEGAFKEYAAYASDRIFIVENTRENPIDADKIYETVYLHKMAYGVAPVVIVDYLQILKPAKDVAKATKREQVDYSVAKLAEIRSQFKAPVILISAFNRDSYNGEASNASFKESGEIEYTGDATLLLTPLLLDRDDEPRAVDPKKAVEDISKHMSGKERAICLTIPKNRMGDAYKRVYFVYTPKYNIFKECDFEEAKKYAKKDKPRPR